MKGLLVHVANPRSNTPGQTAAVTAGCPSPLPICCSLARRSLLLSASLVAPVATGLASHAAQIQTTPYPGYTAAAPNKLIDQPELQTYSCTEQAFQYISSSCTTPLQQPSSAPASGKGRYGRVSAPPRDCTTGTPVTARLYAPGEQLDSTPPSSNPVVMLLSPGFLVSSHAYDSYLQGAVQQGLYAATYDLAQSATQPCDDVDSTQVLLGVMQWCQQQVQQLQGQPVSCNFLLVGHSRGAKVSCLASLGWAESMSLLSSTSIAEEPPAEQASTVCTALGLWPPGSGMQPVNAEATRHTGIGSSSICAAVSWRVCGLVMLDPADSSFEQPASPRYPSAVSLLGTVQQEWAVPTLIVGAGRNKDCIPTRSNYKAFWDKLRSPSALLELQDAGHFAFLDVMTTLQASVCNLGAVPQGRVPAVASEAVQAWRMLCVPTAGMASTSWQPILAQDALERVVLAELGATSGVRILAQ